MRQTYFHNCKSCILVNTYHFALGCLNLSTYNQVFQNISIFNPRDGFLMGSPTFTSEIDTTGSLLQLCNINYLSVFDSWLHIESQNGSCWKETQRSNSFCLPAMGRGTFWGRRPELDVYSCSGSFKYR